MKSEFNRVDRSGTKDQFLNHFAPQDCESNQEQELPVGRPNHPANEHGDREAHGKQGNAHWLAITTMRTGWRLRECALSGGAKLGIGAQGVGLGRG